MARRPRQESTYIHDDLGEQLDAAVESSGKSKAEILREGLRRQLQVMEIDSEGEGA